MSPLSKPACGGVTELPSSFDEFLRGVLFVGGAIGMGSGLAWLFGVDGSSLLFTLFGVDIIVSVGLGALAGAGMVGWWVVSSAWHRISPPDGLRRCYAGVVNEIARAFSTASDYLLPWTAEHDRFDVVVKSDYWDIPVLPNWKYVYCAGDALESPLIRSYQKNEEVVGAAIGSIVGAAVGLVLGSGLGALVGGLLLSICAAGGPIVLLCLLLAIFVAFAVAAATETIVSIIGGTLGRLLASTGIIDTERGARLFMFLELGSYVTVTGNIIQYGIDNGAYVAYWVTRITLHGRSLRAVPASGEPKFSHTDPDQFLQPDACGTAASPSG